MALAVELWAVAVAVGTLGRDRPPSSNGREGSSGLWSRIQPEKNRPETLITYLLGTIVVSGCCWC